jgi:transposase-like protein
MTSSGRPSVFAGFRFSREVIAVAVRSYLRYGLSYRDIEERWPSRISQAASGEPSANGNAKPRPAQP